MAQKNQSGRSYNLAARQHNDAAVEGQFDDATESTGHATQFGVNNTTRTPTRTTCFAVVSPALDIVEVFLGRGGFTNSPGNKKATEFICGACRAQCQKPENKGNKHFAKDVYDAMSNMGYRFKVKKHGSSTTADESHALKYIQRQLREGEVASEERRQRRAKYKDNHPNLVAFRPIVEEEDTFRPSGSICPRSHRQELDIDCLWYAQNNGD